MAFFMFKETIMRNDKLYFLDVNPKYIEYLKQFDHRIPDVIYEHHEKFMCGAMFKVHGLDYFAPVSSNSQNRNMNFVIKVGGVSVGSVRVPYMFPVPSNEIQIKNLRDETDTSYQFLMKQELKYCNDHIRALRGLAFQVYNQKIKHTKGYEFCCDFLGLENKCKDWIVKRAMEKLTEGVPISFLSFQEKMSLLQKTNSKTILNELLHEDNGIIVGKARERLEKEFHVIDTVKQYEKVILTQEYLDGVKIQIPCKYDIQNQFLFGVPNDLPKRNIKENPKEYIITSKDMKYSVEYVSNKARYDVCMENLQNKETEVTNDELEFEKD